MSSTYHIAHGDQVTGPFTEEQMLNMWRMGQITADAQVMMIGTEEWVPIQAEITTIEAFKPRAPARDRGAMYGGGPTASGPQINYGTAMVLSVLVPGLGHIYAGQAGGGIALLIFIGAFGFTLLWPVALLLYMWSLFDVRRAVEKRNDQA
jgi:TM2 domain-containing membrane protein YozV